MDRPGETELARALLAGETDAFERFVEHFRSKIFHYSWLMCGQPDDAEEVAQETLLKVFQNFRQLREPKHVRAWIFRIAKNACLTQRRVYRSLVRRTRALERPVVDPHRLDPGVARQCQAPRFRPVRDDQDDLGRIAGIPGGLDERTHI